MGKLALAAKITHVPSMYLSERPGAHFGCRDSAINGHKEIDRRCRKLGVDTFVVFDVHWQVNSEYHINCGPRFEGVYTSNELPHFIRNMPYAYPGNPALGHLISDVANEIGVKSRAHSDTTLELEYGTLVPMRYMNADQHYKVVSVSGWCDWHDLEESGRFGLAVRRAIEERYDGTVAILASGSMSHHFADNGRAPEFMHKVYSPFLEQVDHLAIRLGSQPHWPRSPPSRHLRFANSASEGSRTGVLFERMPWHHCPSTKASERNSSGAFSAIINALRETRDSRWYGLRMAGHKRPHDGLNTQVATSVV